MRLLGWGAILLIVLFVASSFAHLSIEPGTGAHAVGRQRITWVDETRPERHTPDPSDHRVVPVQLWYPAQRGTGRPAPYIEDLEVIRDGLVASGELGRIEALALGLVRDQARTGAAVAESSSGFPVVLLSPGNATNVAFYATLAEELASQGHVVVGIDHPFQVTAVRLPDGAVAVYDPSVEKAASPAAAERTRTDIEERIGDISFVLDRLTSGGAGTESIGRHLDLDRVGVVGHSNGGVAAAAACRRDERFAACANIDGQNQGGPFGHESDAEAPLQPFMFLTKEAVIHPELGRRFEEAGSGAVRVVLPSAEHGDFADGALFGPRVNPFPGRAGEVSAVTRGFATRFFAGWLGTGAQPTFDGIEAGTDVYVNVYPLGARTPLPSAG